MTEKIDTARLRALLTAVGQWAPNGLRAAMLADGYGEGDAELCDAAVNALPALLDRLAALEAVAAAARARCADAVPQWAPELREALRVLDETNDRSRR